jgi:hypothetical protein
VDAVTAGNYLVVAFGVFSLIDARYHDDFTR